MTSAPVPTSRLDRWGTTATLVVVTVLAAASEVGGPLRRWILGDDLRLVVDGRTAGVVTGDDVESVEAVLRVPAGVTERLVDLLPGVATTLVLVVGASIVLRVASDVNSGRPFAERNATRLRVLAVVVLVAPVLLAYVEMACHQVVLHLLDLDAEVATLQIPGWGIVAGLLCLVLAQAFATGTRLQDDAEGLV